MFDALAPLLWTLFSLFIVLILQRWIHRHLQGVGLLLTGSIFSTDLIYALILFPGVLLHELSHWLTANLLGIRTGKLSLIPRRLPDGSLQLGYVEYYKNASLGPIRESLVGGAPLIFGTSAVLLIGLHIFGVSNLATVVQTGHVDGLSTVIGTLFATADFWFWLYLIFAISNAMMPSRSDRRAWPAFFALILLVALALYLLGMADVVLAGLAGPAALVFGYLGLAFSMTIAVNLLAVVFIFALEELISRLKGMHVEYGRGQTQLGDAP